MRRTFRVIAYSLAFLLLSLLATLPGSATGLDHRSPPLSSVGLLSRFAREHHMATTAEQAVTQPDGGVPQTEAQPQGIPTEIKVNQDYSNAPQNETTIAVNPDSPNMLIAGANDYRLGVPVGAAFYTSTNGGISWTDGFPPFPLLAGAGGNHVAPSDTQSQATGVSASEEEGNDPDKPKFGEPGQTVEPPYGTGDPVLVFGHARAGSGAIDAGTSVAYYAYLGVSTNNCEQGIFVSRSTNGLTWTRPVVPPLYPPHGLYTAVYWDRVDDCSVFNDKPWIAVDRGGGPHDGRLYVVWAQFTYEDASFRGSTIEMTYSDDNAESWTAPINVSGVSPELCPAQVSGKTGRCDESQFATVVVAPDGTVDVAFLNQQAHGAEDGFRNQYLATSVNPDTLALSGPYRAASLIDGQLDFPTTGMGQATLCNSNFRLNSSGNLTIDPSDATGKTLYIVFTDDRNGSSFPERPMVTQDPQDSFNCPDGKNTDADIFIVRSDDGGATWADPVRVNQDAVGDGKDQWFPFAVVALDGTVSVVFDDRRDDFFNRLANVYVASSKDHGATWTDQRITTTQSNLNWMFDAGGFMGDYNGMAVGPSGTVYPLWTDSRNASSSTRQSDIYMAIVPPH